MHVWRAGVTLLLGDNNRFLKRQEAGNTLANEAKKKKGFQIKIPTQLPDWSGAEAYLRNIWA